MALVLDGDGVEEQAVHLRDLLLLLDDVVLTRPFDGAVLRRVHLAELAASVLRVGSGGVGLHVVAVLLLFEVLVQVLLSALLVLLGLEPVGITWVYLLRSAADSSHLSSGGTSSSTESFGVRLESFAAAFDWARTAFRPSHFLGLPAPFDDLLVDARVLMRILLLRHVDGALAEIAHLRVLRRIGLGHHLDLQLGLVVLRPRRDPT